MEIKLSAIESERVFYDALCNGLGYIGGYGLRLDWEDAEYKEAKKTCLKEMVEPCIEDILYKMLLMGYGLTLIDIECDGEYTSTITLKDVHERVPLAPTDHLLDMLKEEGDANTADIIIQTVFYNEIIFG